MEYFNGIETITVTRFNETQFILQDKRKTMTQAVVSLDNMTAKLKEKVIKHFNL